MPSTISTGADTIRMPQRLMDPLLHVATLGGIGPGTIGAEQLEELRNLDLLIGDELHPLAGAIFELIAAPGLVVTAERSRLGGVSAATVWATPFGAAIGTRLDDVAPAEPGNAFIELRLAVAAMIPIQLMQIIRLRPLPTPEQMLISTSADEMLRTEIDLLEGASPDGSGEPDGDGRLRSVLSHRVATWRIHSVWSGAEGRASADIAGMDCGPLGNLLVTVDDTAAISLRSASFQDVTRAIRTVLPPAGSA